MCVCPSIVEQCVCVCVFLWRRAPHEWAFTHFQFDQGRKWGNDFRDEAVMERVVEYSGIVSVSSHRRGGKSVHVFNREFHSLPTSPVIIKS